jgi:peptidoglycan/LPS O-acetylase OafA/YrhL
MGLLRLWLAFCVLRDHTSPLGAAWLPDGFSAVQAFFVLSGFAMAMVLEDKYGTDRRSFWVNRFIKLWPAYAVVMVLALAYEIPLWSLRHIGAGVVQEVVHGPSASPLAWLIVALSNLSMLGLDLLGLIGLDPRGQPSLIVTAPPLTFNLAHYIVLPQAWSLSIEMAFYALAPWYVRLNTPALVLICVGGILGRVAYLACGLPVYPWASHFTPVDLSTFAAGILSWRAYRAMPQSQGAPRAWLQAALAWGLVLGVPALCRGPLTQTWALGAAAALALPWIFAPLRGLAWDRALGEWAYPLYLLHYLIAYVGMDLAAVYHVRLRFWALVPAALIISALFWRLMRPALADLRRKLLKPSPGGLHGS